MKIGIIITPATKRIKLIKALKEENVDYTFINLLDDQWFEYFQDQFDGYLVYPPAFTYEWRNIFFKRLYYINHLIKDKMTPSLEAISMYESKISMHDFYKVHNIPHIKSHTFYNFQDALEYAHGRSLPVVVKEDDGSGAMGVKIVKERKELINLIKKSFYLENKIKTKWDIKKIKQKLYPFKIAYDTKQNYFPFKTKRKGFIHIQNYEEVKYEWRIIRIGESYFGHKKIENDEGYHSGTLNKGWGEIPYRILNLVREVSNRLNLNMMSFDLFETINGELYFNELQVVFGTSTEQQLMIDNKAGRYIFDNNKWIFEAGDFARNGCENLKIRLVKKSN